MSTTLNDVAKTVAKYLGRAATDGTILDLEEEIKDEIGQAVKFYNRKQSYLTEFRECEITTAAGTVWYSAFTMANGAGEQSNSRTSVSTSDIVKIQFMRDTANNLNERLDRVSYREFERLRDGTAAQTDPTVYTFYAGQIGLWPTPSGTATVEFSGHIKPQVPTADTDTSVWFDEADELIALSAARRVLKNHLRDTQRALEFADEEALAWSSVESEQVRKSSGRIRAHG